MSQTDKKSHTSIITKLSLGLIILGLIVAGVLYGVPRYYYDVTDWVQLQTYQPPEEIAALADESQMSDEGRRIFYVHRPQINDREEFNENCPFKERTFVLGCYTGDNIYIFSIEDEQLKSVEPVTAAHEMLHAVYTRLSSSERSRIDRLLKVEFEKSDDQRLIDIIEQYNRYDPAAVSTELHSIIGTEVRDISPELESHYSRYFDNRLAVVEQFEGYESIFSELENQIDVLRAEINSLKKRIEDTEKQIDVQAAEINSINNQLDNLRSQGNISAYNALVPRQNSLVNSYNATIDNYRQLIRSHNTKVEKINDIAIKHTDLLNSLNSKYEQIDGQN